MQFFLSSWVPMCVALISVAACNSFRDSHQLRITYGSPDLQSFLICALPAQRKQFSVWILSVCPALRRPLKMVVWETIFNKRPIRQQVEPVNNLQQPFCCPYFQHPLNVPCLLTFRPHLPLMHTAFLRPAHSDFFIPQRSFPFPQLFL